MMWRVDHVVHIHGDRRAVLQFAGFVSAPTHVEAWAKARVWFTVNGTIMVRDASALHPFVAILMLPPRSNVQFVHKLRWHATCK